MAKIYREALSYFVSSLAFLTLFAVLIEGFLWFAHPKTESATLVALVILAYVFHRHFLFGETMNGKALVSGAPPFKFGRFLLVTAALTLGPVFLVFCAFYVLDLVGEPARPGLVVASLPAYLLSLSLFGTALPATVARDGSYRLSQGLRRSWQTMAWLLLGPCVTGLVLFFANILGLRALVALGVRDGSLVVLAYFILVRTLGFLTTILAVAVLCEMYKRTRPDPGALAGLQVLAR